MSLTFFALFRKPGIIVVNYPELGVIDCLELHTGLHTEPQCTSWTERNVVSVRYFCFDGRKGGCSVPEDHCANAMAGAFDDGGTAIGTIASMLQPKRRHEQLH